MDGTHHTGEVLPYYELPPPGYSELDPTIFPLHRVWATEPWTHEPWAEVRWDWEPVPCPAPSTERQQGTSTAGAAAEPHGSVDTAQDPPRTYGLLRVRSLLKAFTTTITSSMLMPMFVQSASECAACEDVFEPYCKLRARCIDRSKKFDEALRKPIELDCKHKYCRPCFNELVSIACDTEGTFPPRCCNRRINYSHVVENLSPAVMAKYHNMVRISNIPANNRWYCRSAGCGEVNDTRSLGGTNRHWQCRKCARRACALCRSSQHNGRCNRDDVQAEADREVMQSYKSCPGCGVVIDLVDGCRHVTCRCGYEFW